MKILAIIFLLFTPFTANAGREAGLGHHVVTMTGSALKLCPAADTKFFARDVVIQNQTGSAANIAVGDSSVLDTEANGGIVVAPGSAISFTQPLNAGDYYDLCKIFADGTNLDKVSVTYVK